MELERKFSTENKATNYFILVVVDAYLKALFDGITVPEPKEKRSKEQWKKKWDMR